MKLNRNTQQKMVSASGAISLLVALEGVPHLRIDEPENELDEALELARHADGAAARRDEEHAKEQSASATEKKTLSKFTTEKSINPTGVLLVRKVM